MVQGDDLRSLFGSNRKMQAENIALAAAFADDDDVAAKVAQMPLQAIENPMRRFLFRAARGSRMILGAVDDEQVWRMAARRAPDGATGFYADAMAQWVYAVTAQPALVDDAVALLQAEAA